jgi:diguanylate cyclase (GGDEF)-like protein
VTADDDRERGVQQVVALVACFAAVTLALAVRAMAGGTVPPLWMVLAYTALSAAASYAAVEVRIGGNRLMLHWGDAAFLLGLTLLPAPWLVAATTVGVLAAKLAQRMPAQKVVFNTAKATVSTAASCLVALAIEPGPIVLQSWRGLLALLVSLLCLLVVSELLVGTVLSRASGRRLRDILLAGGQAHVVIVVGNLVAALVTIALIGIDDRLVVVVPFLVLCLHLLYSNRVRTRAERETWQRIALATDRFSDVDLEAVLRAAVTGAAELFSADEVEVVVHLGNEPPGLVRGTDSRITWAGHEADAPPARAMEQVLPVPIGRQGAGPAAVAGPTGPDAGDRPGDQPGTGTLGELRLRFAGKVRLTEREQYALHTFAAALGTALRNAYAYAQSQRTAARNAHDAAHDPLTGLANRRHLMSHGEELLAARPLRGIHALVLIDLDHFKEINDTLGHPAGDQVLTTVGRRLATAAGPEDVVVRLGGDEFAVLFVGLPAPALAMHRARQMVATLDPPIEVDGIRIHVAGSGGVSLAPAQGGVAELLRRADVAMYEAKREGLRVSQYSRSRDTADVARLSLGGDLRAALDGDQFAVHFQPLVDLSNGLAIGAEALTRWRHPYRGNLSPVRFLSAIERSGMLPAFSEIVLTEALTAAQSWRTAGHQVGISVNVSPRSLLDPTYPQLVERRLNSFDVPADQVTLELTETLTLSRLDVVDEVLTALRELGVRIALDDFGTGYSSLSMLARVPVHELKIDRSFVAGMATSAEASAVVRSTIDLGRGLDLTVVAEGVENQQQRGLLFELGCLVGQGHLFSRPVTGERFAAILDGGGSLAPPLSSDAQVIRIPPARLTRSRRRL